MTRERVVGDRLELASGESRARHMHARQPRVSAFGLNPGYEALAPTTRVAPALPVAFS